MLGGVWANKQWLPISLVRWGFEYFLHGIIHCIYIGIALFSTVFIPNLTTPQPHSERRIYKIMILNWKDSMIILFDLYHCKWYIFNMFITCSDECSVRCQCGTKYDIKNYVHPSWGWQRNLSSQDYFQHHRNKQKLTEHGKWNLAINDQGWEGDSNSHYINLMNTFVIFLFVLVQFIYYILLFLNYFNLHYLNFKFVYFDHLSA